MNKPATIVLATLLGSPALGQEVGHPIAVVAAENFYGDLARQIGGSKVAVVSIMTNPDQDPHLFEASASTARQLAAARVVIYNGADYDPWMVKLLAASRAPNRVIIAVAELLNRKPGENPHVWYDPRAMPIAAQQLTNYLDAIDPAYKAEYDARLQGFRESLRPLNAKVAAMREKFAGTAVTATEPVFGYMAEALGLRMRNLRFQLAIMNNAEPRASDVASFQNDLKRHKVKLLLYNSQASEPLTRRMRDIATAEKIPVVGVSETEPPGTTYQDWMLRQLDELERGLAGAAP